MSPLLRKIVVAIGSGAGAVVGWQMLSPLGTAAGALGAGIVAGLAAWMAAMVANGDSGDHDGTAW